MPARHIWQRFSKFQRTIGRSKIPKGNFMKILGIDPGTQVAGYGVIEKIGSTVRVVEYDSIKVNKEVSLFTLGTLRRSGHTLIQQP